MAVKGPFNVDLVEQFDQQSPANADLKLAAHVDALTIAFKALLAKLNADAGVTDANYVALLSVKDLGA